MASFALAIGSRYIANDEDGYTFLVKDPSDDGVWLFADKSEAEKVKAETLQNRYDVIDVSEILADKAK